MKYVDGGASRPPLYPLKVIFRSTRPGNQLQQAFTVLRSYGNFLAVLTDNTDTMNHRIVSVGLDVACLTVPADLSTMQRMALMCFGYLFSCHLRVSVEGNS